MPKVIRQTYMLSYRLYLLYMYSLDVWHEILSIVGRESKPRNSDFYQNVVFCQRGNTKRMAHVLSNPRSSRLIRTLLKSINHASKYRIYEKFHYFGAHFTEIRGFSMKKMLKMSKLDGFSRKWSK